MTTTMIDATHASVANVPATTAKVAGYVSGTPDIQWTATDWARFPHSGRVRIEQGYGPWPPPDPHGYDVLDVEDRAVEPGQVPAEVRKRINNGIGWTTVYGSDDALKDTQAALIAAEKNWGTCDDLRTGQRLRPGRVAVEERSQRPGQAIAYL